MAKKSALDVSVRGIEKTIKKTALFELALRERIQTQVLQSARAVRKEARQRVPVNSGVLKKSIKIKRSKDKLYASVGPRNPEGWYAHFIEFGTKKMDAKPFMTPAWESVRPTYEKGIKDAIKGAMP